MEEQDATQSAPSTASAEQEKQTSSATGTGTSLSLPNAAAPKAAVEPVTETPQQEFDRLVERKMYLDSQIKMKPREIRELTPEQKEIDQIDERLMELWQTGSVTRKEG